MSRRPDRVVVHRRRGRAAGTNWIPWVLLIAILVIGGIVVWQLMTGDDADAAALLLTPVGWHGLAQRDQGRRKARNSSPQRERPA